jgi:hypothetical protein
MPGVPLPAMFFWISAVNASKKTCTSFLLVPVASAMLFKISVFVGGFGPVAFAMDESPEN